MANQSRGYWRKGGLIFRPEGQGGWMNSHAQVPTALMLPDRIRVYFSSRPSPKVSLTTYVDLDPERPQRILGLSEKPILELGGPGTFDEHGIMPAAVVTDGDQVRLYYSGWCQLAGAAPYHNSTGLAVSEDGGRSFRRLVDGPVLDRAPYDPFSATSPWVMRVGPVWHTFYSSGRGWINVEGKLEHIYDLRHATSSDGIYWQRDCRAAIAQAHPGEALTRPSLWFRDGEWWMWFSYRGSREFRAGKDAYRIGFARSTDLIKWQREDDRAGIHLSESGWDSQMLAYPCVVKTPTGMIMLYNGNNFGRDGFGYAVWQES